MAEHQNHSGKGKTSKKSTRAISMEHRIKPPRRPKLGNQAKLTMAIGLAICLGILLPVLFFRTDGTDKTQSEAPPSLSMYALPPAINQPASSAVSLPENAIKPDIAFTEEEILLLNNMLYDWAQVQTEVLITKDEDGQPLEEPYRKPDGGHEVGLWFMDLESGATYGYNAQEQFYYASVMKAPYAAYLYVLAAQGACDLEEVITVDAAQVAGYEENTGVIRTMPLPAPFTVEQLIGYAVQESDTVALKVLLKRYPAEGFRQWAEELGVADVDALKSVVHGTTSPADAGVLLQGIWQVIEHNPYGERLRMHMENAGNKMIRSDYTVAHKYGWDEDAYHDIAIVYAPRPYLLVIFTDKWGGTWEEREMFATIAQTLEGMVAAKYEELGL